MRKSSVLFLAAVLSACSGAEDESPTPTATPELNAVDVRPEFPDAPADGIQWQTADFVIPSSADREMCYFFTYDGEDKDVNFVQYLQSEYGHHVILLEFSGDEEQFPDGTFMDCTDPNAIPMNSLQPWYIAANEDHLPEGMAVKLVSGTRYVIQSHYINTEPNAIRVQDTINLGFAKPEEVEFYTAAYSNNTLDFTVPPGEQASAVIECEVPNDIYLSYLIGHMHEWGKHLDVEFVHPDGSVKLAYSYDWKPEYRDFPPTKIYPEFATQLKAGDIIRTTCTWFNDTDHELKFPSEMCATSGMMYPAESSWLCEGSWQ